MNIDSDDIIMKSSDYNEFPQIFDKLGEKQSDGGIIIKKYQFKEFIRCTDIVNIYTYVKFEQCKFDNELVIKYNENLKFIFDFSEFTDIKIVSQNIKVEFACIQCNKLDVNIIDSQLTMRPCYQNIVKELVVGGANSDFNISMGKFDCIRIYENKLISPCDISYSGEVGLIDINGRINSKISFFGIELDTLSFEDFVNEGLLIFNEIKPVNYSGFIQIRNSLFNDVVFNRFEFDKFKFMIKNAVFSKAIFNDCGFINVKNDLNPRSIYRQLKCSSKSNDDQLSYLYYKAKELDAYRHELKGVKPWLTNDKIILWLSKWSNYYGFRWTWALVFILVVSTAFFTLSIFTLGNWPVSFGWISYSESIDSLTLVSRKFFDFLNPTHSHAIFDNYSPNPVTYLWDLMGRIFVGFGIYQLIRAFRKFVI